VQEDAVIFARRARPSPPVDKHALLAVHIAERAKSMNLASRSTAIWPALLLSGVLAVSVVSPRSEPCLRMPLYGSTFVPPEARSSLLRGRPRSDAPAGSAASASPARRPGSSGRGSCASKAAPSRGWDSPCGAGTRTAWPSNSIRATIASLGFIRAYSYWGAPV